MLNHLVDNFEEKFLIPFDRDQELVKTALVSELENLTDPAFLEKDVIGEPLFAWDYRAIDEGCLDLMKPFMESHSYTPLFFCSILRDLGCDPEKYIKASLLLEYSYYSLGVIDYFDFHKAFTRHDNDLKSYAELTQLRYAAQYLIQYPRYLVIQNAFDLSKSDNIALHKLYATMGVTTGCGRGVFQKWANNYFKDISEANYFQNCIHTLNNFLIFPVMTAAVFAKVSEADKNDLQDGFAALTLFSKLRLEKQIYLGQKDVAVQNEYTDLFSLLSFPGMALLHEKIEIDDSQFKDEKYPWVTKMQQDMAANVAAAAPEKAIAAIEKMEKELFETFLAKVSKTKLLGDTVSRICECYEM